MKCTECGKTLHANRVASRVTVCGLIECHDAVQERATIRAVVAYVRDRADGRLDEAAWMRVAECIQSGAWKLFKVAPSDVQSEEPK